MFSNEQFLVGPRTERTTREEFYWQNLAAKSLSLIQTIESGEKRKKKGESQFGEKELPWEK